MKTKLLSKYLLIIKNHKIAKIIFTFLDFFHEAKFYTQIDF